MYPQSIEIVNQLAILPDTAAISCSVDILPFVVTVFVKVVVPGGFVLLGTGWRKQTSWQLSVEKTWRFTLLLDRHLWSGISIRQECIIYQACPQPATNQYIFYGVPNNLSINFYQSGWYYGNCSPEDEKPSYEVVAMGKRAKWKKR